MYDTFKEELLYLIDSQLHRKLSVLTCKKSCNSRSMSASLAEDAAAASDNVHACNDQATPSARSSRVKSETRQFIY